MAKSIEAKNLTAQLRHRGAGNPPSAHPYAAISNCFPGLEMDFRNVWKFILEGIELHEASNLVVGVDPKRRKLAPLKKNYSLITVAGKAMTAPVTGPRRAGGPNGSLSTVSLEWSNALAEVLSLHQGKLVECRFEPNATGRAIIVKLKMRRFFDEASVEGKTVRRPAISRELAPPGALTQSLCSPWQNDYRECACYYWAATRPDYVNIEAGPDGASIGNNWLEKGRTPSTPRVYIVDDFVDPRLTTYEDLFRAWEKELRFILGGGDE